MNQKREDNGRFAKKEFKCLGRISFAEFGLDNDNMDVLGLRLHFKSKEFCGGVSEQYCFKMWRGDRTEISCKKIDYVMDVMEGIYRILKDAKKNNIKDLAGVPVEITYTNGGLKTFKSFRVLTEVL